MRRSAPLRGTPLRTYDGVAELWWESLDELLAASSSEDGQRASMELLEDEQRFIEMKSSPLWLGEEHVVIGLVNRPFPEGPLAPGQS